MSQLTTSTPRQSALSVMADRFSVEPQKLLSTLKSTVFKGASDDELLALVVVANEYGLNPLTKEIYAFPAKGGGIVPIVSVDGWANLANSHPQFDGLDFEWHHDSEGKLVACTCSIWRKDRSRPIKVTEYLSECKRGTEPWKMEHRMLRHKALIQCARLAFGYSGVYDEDEARDIGIRDVTNSVTQSNPVMDKPNWMKLKESSQTKEDSEQPADPKPESLSPADQVAKLLEAEGITIQQVEQVLRNHRLLKGSMPILSVADLPQAAIKAILQDTATFLDAVRSLK